MCGLPTVAPTSEMIPFETEIQTIRKHLKSFMDVPGKWIYHVRQHGALDKLIPDLDSSLSETRAHQEGTA